MSADYSAEFKLAGSEDYNPRFPPANAKKGYVARLTGRDLRSTFGREFLAKEIHVTAADCPLLAECQTGEKKGGHSRCEVRPHGVPVTPLKGHRVLLLRRPLPGGMNTMALNGRRPGGERLPRGRYRASLQATDAAGAQSDTVFIRFTVC